MQSFFNKEQTAMLCKTNATAYEFFYFYFYFGGK